MAGAFRRATRPPHRKPFIAPDARDAMKPARPDLGLVVYDQIALQWYEVDKYYWEALGEIQMPTPAAEAVFAYLRRGEPRPPQRPERLTLLLQGYANALFVTEAERYPNHPQLGHWLARLAERVVAKVMETIKQIDKKNKLYSLAYHGLSETQMRQIMTKELGEATKKRLDSNQAISAASHDGAIAKPTVPTEKQRLSATVTCPAAARKLESYLRANAIGLTEFATKAQTTDRTLRTFRRTGNVRRDIFDNIAKAMGLTKEKLLKG
jgi:hypothetical protein